MAVRAASAFTLSELGGRGKDRRNRIRLSASVLGREAEDKDATCAWLRVNPRSVSL